MASSVLRRADALTVAGLRLPTGRSLVGDVWRKLHGGVLVLLALHAVGLAGFGLYMGANPLHVALEGGIVAAVAALAAWPRLGRRAQSVLAAFGLMSSSAILVHLSGGYIEAHFHFFVMLGIIFLYEDWLPYALAVSYVAIHHGVVGSLDPLSVYNHPSALADPWRWAGVHAVFILGLSTALLVAWNVIERARDAEAQATHEAQELKRQLHSQEKLAALGSLVSGLAHEIRTPLTIASSNASLLERAARADPANPLAPRVLEHTSEIQASAERINSLVVQLRRFHALAPEEMRVVPLHALVKDAVRLFRSAHKTPQRIEADLAPTAAANLHPLGVHQIVLNLLSNAVEATHPEGGLIRIRTRAEATHAVLIVEDNGSGMSEETQRRAFDPLFTTKKEGMGLGLHIVRRIVEAHGGEITLTSSPGRGTAIEVRFRAAAAERTPAPAPAPAVAPALGA